MSGLPAMVAEARGDPPRIALVLGSGLGNVARRIEPIHQLDFTDIPGLAPAGVAGHVGRLTLGTAAGRRLLLFEGRLHRYEGHAWDRVVEPVRVAQALGARLLVVTNAAGGIHEALAPGSFLALADHLDCTQPWWWRRPGAAGVGPARPSPYSSRLRALLHQAAGAVGLELLEGRYAAVTGPTYETPAEVRALRRCGADAVGMSTAREVEVAASLSLECAGLSCITNRAAGQGGALSHAEVLATAGHQAGRLADLLERFWQLV